MANNPRDLTPKEQNDLSNLDTPDVPEYSGGTTAASEGLYTRTGKAAPTEIFPSGEQQSGPLIPESPAPATTAFETASVEREPVYVPPAEQSAVTESVEPTYTESAEPVVVEEETRRGTTDFGLFLLRLALGAFLIIDSVGTFFRLGGNEGISGLETAYANYPYGNGLAVVVPTLELAAGVFLGFFQLDGCLNGVFVQLVEHIVLTAHQAAALKTAFGLHVGDMLHTHDNSHDF